MGIFHCAAARPGHTTRRPRRVGVASGALEAQGTSGPPWHVSGRCEACLGGAAGRVGSNRDASGGSGRFGASPGTSRGASGRCGALRGAAGRFGALRAARDAAGRSGRLGVLRVARGASDRPGAHLGRCESLRGAPGGSGNFGASRARLGQGSKGTGNFPIWEIPNGWEFPKMRNFGIF